MYLMIVEADHNDGDYVNEIWEVHDNTKDKLEKLFLKLRESYSKAIKAGTDIYQHLYEKMYADFLTEDEINEILEYMPYTEYGIHTIESVKFYKITNEAVTLPMSVRWNTQY